MPENIVEHLKNFRDKIYKFFHYRRDATIELIDAISSNIAAKSVVELSLNPLHRRNYCSITRVLDEFRKKDQIKNEENTATLTKLLSENCLSNQNRNYHLFAVDTTPQPRIHAKTLQDRGYVYVSNSGKKPVKPGHQYSIVTYLPEKLFDTPSWVIPLACKRVSSDAKGNLIGMRQITDCIKSQTSFTQSLCVSTGDCAYSQALCLDEAKKKSQPSSYCSCKK